MVTDTPPPRAPNTLAETSRLPPSAPVTPDSPSGDGSLAWVLSSNVVVGVGGHLLGSQPPVVGHPYGEELVRDCPVILGHVEVGDSALVKTQPAARGVISVSEAAIAIIRRFNAESDGTAKRLSPHSVSQLHLTRVQTQPQRRNSAGSATVSGDGETATLLLLIALLECWGSPNRRPLPDSLGSTPRKATGRDLEAATRAARHAARCPIGKCPRAPDWFCLMALATPADGVSSADH